MEEAIKQGKYPAKTPFGYIKNEKKKLEINPMEAEIVKDIFDLYSQGNNASKVASIMKKDNRYLRNGEKWNESKITRIINNPIYKGDMLWGIYKREKKNQILIPNHSPAIITKDLWDKCQRELDKNSHGNYGENIHIFNRVIRCPECHELMNSFFTIKYQNKKKKYNYYVRCLNKRCDKKGVIYSCDKIENKLVNILNDLSGIAILSEYSLNFPIVDNKDDIDRIKGALTKIKNDENKLLDFYLQSNIKSDVLTTRLNSLASEREKLEEKKNKLESDIVLNYNKDLNSLYNDKKTNDIEEIAPIWSILSRDTKRSIISSLIKYIDIKKDNNYNITIENIVFNNEYLQNKFYDLPTYLLNKFRDSYKNISYLGMCTKEQLKETFPNKEMFSFNELVKNYTSDRKNLETIINRFNDFDLGIVMIIEDKKFIDSMVVINN